MSDTDDTDVLLLIPPDFFLIHSDSDSSLDDNWSTHCHLHCGLVENLAGEVGAIKHRLNSIENSSEVSWTYHTVNNQDMSGRHFQFNDIYPNQRVTTSAKSTPQKPRTILVANSLPSTPSTERENPRKHKKEYGNKYETKIIPGQKSHSTHSIQTYDRDADVSSLTTTPDKQENKAVLGEIDQFLSHVKTIKRYVAQRKLENSFPSPEKTTQHPPISFEDSPLKLSDLKGEGDGRNERRKALDLKEVNKLLHVMEMQQERMEKQVTVPNRVVEGNEKQANTWKQGENKNTVPNYDYGMRDAMYAKEDNKKLSETIHDYIANKIKLEANLDLKSDLSDSTNDTSPPTVFERNSEEFLRHIPQKEIRNSTNFPYDFRKQNVFDYVTQNAPEKLDHDSDVEIPDKQKVQSNLPLTTKHKRNSVFQHENRNFTGLVDLWNNNQKREQINYNTDFRNSKLASKLEEERMRRQHCEKLIQDLQLKHLEMQQRLAVAVQVDCAKDAAILKFHEAWEKVADRWQALESERNQLALKLNTVRGKSDVDIAEANKKVAHYETEMSKALDLAHMNQEKCNNLKLEKEKMETELKSIKTELESVQKKLQNLEVERKDLKEKILDLEKDNIQEKKIVVNLQKEITVHKQKSQSEISGFQSEVKHLQEEKSKLERQVKDTKETCESLESKNKTLESVVENCKKNEKVLQNEINKLLDQAEKAKVDLRNFYQQQVEALVKDKLREFQAQLETTEKMLHDELQNREQNIAKTAARQLQKLTDKHHVEVQLLEEKHKEEINLYDIQINQLKHLIASQQNKLDHIQMKRNNIAQELKSVMEAQWNEALKIINRSPTTTPKEHKITGLPRYQNYESENEKKFNDELKHQLPENEKPIDNIEQRINVALITTPMNEKECYRESPRSNNELQKYIKMLLDKEPGNPTEDIQRICCGNIAASDCNNISSYPNVVSLDPQEAEKKNFVQISKEHQHRTSKPPWK